MPRAYLSQTSFAGGEWAPTLAARVDLDRYATSVKELTNFVPLPQGPAERRRGFIRVGAVKDQATFTRLLPFIKSDADAVMLELGAGYLRFWRSDGTPITDTPERITNGTFDTDISGWTSVAPGALLWHAATQSLKLFGSVAGAATARQAVSIAAVGNAHTLRLDVAGLPTGHVVTVRVGTTPGGQEVLANTPLGNGHHDLGLTPSAATVYLELAVSAFIEPTVDTISLTADGATVVEVVTPYAESDLLALQSAQSLDVLYLTDGTHPPQALARYAETDWALAPVTFDVPALKEFGKAPNTTLTPGAGATVAGTTGVTFTAGASVFLASDVGRDLVAKPGRAVLTAQAGTTCTATILEPFRSTDPIAAGAWTLEGSPFTSLDPADGMDQVGETGTAVLGAAGWVDPDDVGKYLRIHGGLLKITGVNTTTSVNVTVVAALAATTPAQATAWSLESVAWSDTRGWPAALGFHPQGRLGWGHTEDVTLSVVDDYPNLRTGSLPDDAVHVRAQSGRLNLVRWLAAATKDYLIGTAGGVFALRASDGGALAPDTAKIDRVARWGQAALQAVVVDPAVLAVDASGQTLRAYTFSFDSDSYVDQDLSLFARHLFAPGLVALAFVDEPTPQIWALRTDGVLLVGTYLPAERVLGWSRVVVGGSAAGAAAVESLAVLPGSGGADTVWVIVRRTLGGATTRTIERLDPTADVWVDGAIRYSGAATGTLTGLDVYDGETVAVHGDGAVFPNQTVVSGAITLPEGQTITSGAVGLPYPSRLVTLPPEGANPAGTSQGQRQRVLETIVRVVDSLGGTVNGVPLRTRDAADPMDQAPALFTGDLVATNPRGWQDAGTVTVEQTLAAPFTVCGLVLPIEVSPK